MELVKGDVVVFNGVSGYAAQKGARAIFQHEDDKYIHVEWIEDELVGGQADGGYFKEDFEKEITKEEIIKKIQEIEANSFLEIKKNQQMFGNDSYMVQSSRSEWMGIDGLMKKLGIKTDLSLPAAQEALRIIIELERN
jgi:hypothetical protein